MGPLEGPVGQPSGPMPRLERAKNTDERGHENPVDSGISPRRRGLMRGSTRFLWTLSSVFSALSRGTALARRAAPQVPPRLPSAPSKER